MSTPEECLSVSNQRKDYSFAGSDGAPGLCWLSPGGAGGIRSCAPNPEGPPKPRKKKFDGPRRGWLVPRGGRRSKTKNKGHEAPQKKARRAPTWLVGSSEAKKVPGLVSFFPDFFNRVLELPSPRNAQNNAMNKSRKTRVLIVDFLVETFRRHFFAKLPSLRNFLKCDKTNKIEEKLTSNCLSIVSEKVSDMEFFPICFMVFLHSSY
jgi:hypothetical protein